MEFKSALIDNNSLSLTVAMDTDSFRDRAGDDNDLMCELIDLFFSDYPRQFENIRRAVQSGNATELGGAAHALKGAVANFSAEPTVRAAARLENMGRTGDLSGAAECCGELANELSRLHTALERLSGEIR